VATGLCLSSPTNGGTVTAVTCNFGSANQNWSWQVISGTSIYYIVNEASQDYLSNANGIEAVPGSGADSQWFISQDGTT
jgi:hypothetical protein